jgi:tetratricopeptide (TPR) repeat protein
LSGSERRATASSQSLFFDGLRTVEGRLPAGLVRLGPPAPAGAIAKVEQALGRPLPHAYAEFLRSFNGADLFNDALIVCGAGPTAARDLLAANAAPHAASPHAGRGHDEEIVIAESGSGDLYALELDAPETHDEPRVFRLRPDADERWLVGSSFLRWLESTIAHEALLYDSEGEFLPDAFEEDGEELTPTFALRQAERALRKDPDSAVYHHEKGLALRRLGNTEGARAAFARAAALDPTNPWPWFDLGRSDHQLGRHAEAAAALECAAEAAEGGESARFAAWAARSFYLAGERATAERLRNVALERLPGLIDALKAAAEAAHEVGDDEAARDADELAELLGAGVPLHRRLPVLGRGPAATPPPSQPRPAKATKPAPARRPPAGKHAPKPRQEPARQKPGRPATKAGRTTAKQKPRKR